uniref:JmjC domain-containing protein 5 n=1 Tax=Saimiri boliviensis boliviensis TaxID=39432 RepID=A0A2K6UZ18_SAIBB
MAGDTHCPAEPLAGEGTLWEALRALLPHTKEDLKLDLGEKVERSVVMLLEQATELFYEGRRAECLQTSEVILDYSWEKLNTGTWRDVDKDWRQVYAMGCLLKVLCLCQAPGDATTVAAALRVCDMGLLMGAAILGDILLKVAAILQAHLPGKRPAHGSTPEQPCPKVDVENPDLEKFPTFAKAPFVSCILSPGEVLFIPVKHWHYVRALDLSFSVSFWWS